MSLLSLKFTTTTTPFFSSFQLLAQLPKFYKKEDAASEGGLLAITKSSYCGDTGGGWKLLNCHLSQRNTYLTKGGGSMSQQQTFGCCWKRNPTFILFHVLIRVEAGEKTRLMDSKGTQMCFPFGECSHTQRLVHQCVV